MADWCENCLTVAGPAADIQTFRDRARTVADGEATELSFGAFVPAPDDEESRSEAWGCRYEADQVDVAVIAEDLVEWRFITPASPPLDWLYRVGLAHPTMDFDLVFAEPVAGFAGRLRIERGSPTVEAEWGGPRARRELAALGHDELWWAA